MFDISVSTFDISVSTFGTSVSTFGTSVSIFGTSVSAFGTSLRKASVLVRRRSIIEACHTFWLPPSRFCTGSWSRWLSACTHRLITLFVGALNHLDQEPVQISTRGTQNSIRPQIPERDETVSVPLRSLQRNSKSLLEPYIRPLTPFGLCTPPHNLQSTP